MDAIIITTTDELKRLISEAITEHFNGNVPNDVPHDNLSIGEAISFLRENGFILSKPTVYRLTSRNQMPYKKFGNRLQFSRQKLLDWANSQSNDPDDNFEELEHLKKSASSYGKRNRS